MDYENGSKMHAQPVAGDMRKTVDDQYEIFTGTDWQQLVKPKPLATPNLENTVKYVISGTRAEFLRWLGERASLLDPDGNVKYKYVADVNTLLGNVNISGYFIGTYKNRPDIDEIFDVIHRSKIR